MGGVGYLVLPKLVAGFLIMVIYIHLSGKGALAPISTIDQVGNVVLGAIIGGTLYNPEVGLLGLTVVSGIWAGLLLFVRYLSNRHRRIKDVVDGKAIRLMQRGKVLSENFSQAGLSIRDFIMLLHQRGYVNLEDLNNVWYEYNGQLTVIKKGDEALATVVIENGEALDDNLARLDFDQVWLESELNKQHAKLEDIFCAEWHHQRLWLYPYEKDEPPAVG